MKEQRALLVRAIFFLMGCLLLGRLIQLQVFRHPEFLRMARENAAKISPLYPPRGWIEDRFGKIIVSNETKWSIVLLPYLVEDNERELLASQLERLAKIPRAETLRLLNQNTGYFQPVVLRKFIPKDLATRLMESRELLRGVAVEQRPSRKYRHGNLLSHALGYVGEISPSELLLLEKEGYLPKDYIGKDGIEKQYDRYLGGKRGGQRVQVDVRGRPVRLTEMVEPIAGMPVRLTIDRDLQEVAEEALGSWEGGVTVLEPTTGRILAMASRPTFDADNVDESLGRTRYPFLNRALSEYPPGSIFKVVTLAAALSEGKANLQEVIHCPGWYQIGTRIAKCWRSTGHGSLSVIEGLVWSCDVVFYELGRRLEAGLLSKYAALFGLGQLSGIDLPNEKAGLAPSESWKQEKRGEPWYPGDFINYGIGQGFVKVTPLQMALLYSAVATGYRVHPYIVEEIRGPDDHLVYSHTASQSQTVPVSSENFQLIRRALREVVRRGTGVVARVAGFPAGGKTGTAENPGLAHAWFICFAPWENPEIVISVMIEHGLHGDRSAAGVARKILTWYQKYRAKRWVFEEDEFAVQHVATGPYRPENYTHTVIRTEIPSREDMSE